MEGQGIAEDTYQYETSEQFEADFWNLLKRTESKFNTFSIGETIYHKGTGCDAAISMTLNQPQSSLDTGTDGKQAQYEPWIIFAHELGHAVKNTHGMGFNDIGDEIYTKEELNAFTPGTKNPEEYANNKLVENPLRRESGMRERTKYEGLEYNTIREFYYNLKRGALDPFIHNYYESLGILSQDEVIIQDKPDLAELKTTLDSMTTIQSQFIQDVGILDKLSQRLRAIPFTKADGTIDAIQVTNIKDLAAEAIWNQIEERGRESCIWIITGFFKRRNFDTKKNICMELGASLQPLRDML